MGLSYFLHVLTAWWPRPREQKPAPVRMLIEPKSEGRKSPRAENKILASAFECTLLQVRHADAAEKISQVSARYSGKTFSPEAGRYFSYFREGGESCASLLALSAARDLRQAFPEASFSLSHGFLRPMAEEKYSGAPIAECERLGPEKGEILATERVMKLASPHVKHRGELYLEHMPFNGALERLSVGQAAAGDAYHTDEHLLEIMGVLESCGDEVFVANAARLRKFSYLDAGPALREAFGKLFQRELARGNSFRLSAVLALAPRFFRGEVPKDIYSGFVSTLTFPDRRVRANAVELFTEIFPSRPMRELRACTKDPDHRVSANAWIKIALEQLDEAVVKALQKRLREGTVALVASALFAVGEIAVRCRQKDPDFLSRRPSFFRILEELPVWARHPNPMVKRQAVTAAHKASDERIDQKMRELFETTDDAELLRLFGSVYDWKKSAAA